MIVYLYRWKLYPEKVEQFQTNWEIVTSGLRTSCGSLGSRLHKGSDGLYYGYAQWPSEAIRENAVLETDEVNTARRLMKEAVEERLPDLVLHPIADYLVGE